MRSHVRVDPVHSLHGESLVFKKNCVVQLGFIH